MRGASVQLDEGRRPDALLFGESPGRVIVSAGPAQVETLLSRARERSVPARRIGRTGGERLTVGPRAADAWIDCPLEALRERWARAIPRRLGE
jgi:phosphoribosylformylglycinamidine (FGAM) synthase-like enzyme